LLAALLAGCGTAPQTDPSASRRNEPAFLAGLADTKARTGYDDHKLLKVGDAMCGLAKESKTKESYVQQLDQVSRTTSVPGTGGSMELILISGTAMQFLCPAESERLRG